MHLSCSNVPRELKGAMVCSVLAMILGSTTAAFSPGQVVTDWPAADVTTTDLLKGEVEHGKFVYSFAAAMTRAGCHVAKVEGERGKAVFVRLDGKRGKSYLDIGHPVFSPDGSALAYRARGPDGCYLVINGQEGPRFEDIGAATFAFSRDGKRHAYVATKDGRPVAVVDGIVQANGGGDFTPCSQPPVFSANGSSVGYFETSRLQRRTRAVINGKPGETFAEVNLRLLQFSRDGLRFAFTARERGRCFFVVDGKRGETFENTGIDFVFSPDGKSSAYVGFEGEKKFLMVEGRPPVEIEGIADQTLTFSPDSRRLAYGAGTRDHWYLVVDGKAGPVYDAVGASFPRGSFPGVTSMQSGYGLAVAESGVVFSPDSHRLAYPARRGGKMVVVVDGKPEDIEMESVVAGVIFSDDSKRLAYGGRQGDRFFLVVDGKKGDDYDALSHFGFSEDGKHIAFAAKKGNRIVIVVDGQERATCTVAAAGPVFRSDGVLEFLAVDGSSLYRVKVRNP